MFLNKKQRGFGWYAKISTTDMGNNTLTSYLNFVFKRGCDPLTDGTYEGDLYFIDKTGAKRKVFPRVKNYNNQNYVEFMLLEEELPSFEQNNEQKGYQSTLREDNKSVTGHIEDIDELPFY